jgi:uncharacterized protein with ParB-like and HNH nuclease domain
MSEQITIEKRDLIAFFRDYDQLNIPIFQREYSWDKENLDYFFETLTAEIDSKDGIDDNSIYLGSLVCTTENGNNNSLIILDGQQRLTTILILFLFLKNKFVKKEKWSFNNAQFTRRDFNIIAEQYISGNNGNLLKLNSHSSDKNDLIAILKEGNAAKIKSKKIRDAIDFFDEKLKELSEKYEDNNIVDFILQRLNQMCVSYVLIDQSANVQDIFEAINSSAKPLSLSDLIVNNLLMHVNDMTEQKIYFEKYIVKWKNSVKNLNDFFIKYISILSAKQISEKELSTLFATYKKCISKKYKNDYKAMFKDIDYFVTAYDAITNLEPLLNYNSEFVNVRYIEIVNSIIMSSETHGGPASFVLIYFKYLHLTELIDDDRYFKIVHILCDFIVKNSISALKGKTLQRSLVPLCSEMEETIANGYGNIIDDVLNFFNTKMERENLKNWTNNVDSDYSNIDEPLFIYKLYYCLSLSKPTNLAELRDIKNLICNKKYWGYIYDPKSRIDNDFLKEMDFDDGQIALLSNQVGNCVKFNYEMSTEEKKNANSWNRIRIYISNNIELEDNDGIQYFNLGELKKRNTKILSWVVDWFSREMK